MVFKLTPFLKKKKKEIRIVYWLSNRLAGLSGKIATDVVTPKIKEIIALRGYNIRNSLRKIYCYKKFNLCLHCYSMFQRQIKMARKLGNVFINEDELIPVLVKASTEIDTCQMISCLQKYMEANCERGIGKRNGA